MSCYIPTSLSNTWVVWLHTVKSVCWCNKKVVLHYGFNLPFSGNYDIKFFFMFIFTIHTSFLVKCPDLLPHCIKIACDFIIGFFLIYSGSIVDYIFCKIYTVSIFSHILAKLLIVFCWLEVLSVKFKMAFSVAFSFTPRNLCLLKDHKYMLPCLFQKFFNVLVSTIRSIICLN